LTLDTGALIALEHRRPRMAKIFAVARSNGLPITVPAVIVAQWWRGQRGPIWKNLAEAVDVEPLSSTLARIAGQALALTNSSDIVDAVVVASAAQRGDIVYTSDIEDLSWIAERAFPSVRILRI